MAQRRGRWMRRRRLGQSDLEITTIGFGAWAIGGGQWWGGYGPQDDADSIGALHRAIESGVNWIDTAPVYGLGHSEDVVGRALAGLAERPLVFTKCGLSWDEAGTVIVDVRPETIRREIEESLRRLQVEAVDLYQIHWPPADAVDKGDIESAWETLVALRDEGKARWIGVSNFSVEQLETIGKKETVTSLQPPYSLLNRTVETEILPYCVEHKVGVIAYSPMASGLLTGSMTRERVSSLPEDDWRRGDENFQEPKLSRNLEVADALGHHAKAAGRSPGELAIAWALRHPAVTGAIVGFRNEAQVDMLVAAADLDLPDELATQIGSLES